MFEMCYYEDVTDIVKSRRIGEPECTRGPINLRSNHIYIKCVNLRNSGFVPLRYSPKVLRTEYFILTKGRPFFIQRNFTILFMKKWEYSRRLNFNNFGG